MITEFSKLVCVPELVILDNSRIQRISDIRELYWLILQRNGFGITDIARLCDRTHGTIISGIRRINKLLEAKDIEITRLYELTKDIKRHAGKKSVFFSQLQSSGAIKKLRSNNIQEYAN